MVWYSSHACRIGGMDIGTKRFTLCLFLFPGAALLYPLHRKQQTQMDSLRFHLLYIIMSFKANGCSISGILIYGGYFSKKKTKMEAVLRKSPSIYYFNCCRYTCNNNSQQSLVCSFVPNFNFWPNANVPFLRIYYVYCKISCAHIPLFFLSLPQFKHALIAIYILCCPFYCYSTGLPASLSIIQSGK